MEKQAGCDQEIRPPPPRFPETTQDPAQDHDNAALMRETLDGKEACERKEEVEGEST